ncbi:glycosyltransferase family 2 protein [Candidatus Pacearchaeota archaeon]|nr:glycosyltransferase family 2 protein [Candidatus Pacearchaeota archaeon]
MPYSLKDISVVIPTFNRADELAITLKAFKPHLKYLREVIVVDQSANNASKQVVKRQNLQKIRYIHSSTPSITRARNLGVKHASPASKIICFTDDDVSVGANYFVEILKVFNAHPEAKAAAGYVPYEKNMPLPSTIEKIARKLFFLGGRLYENDASIVSAYGNRYPLVISQTINADWMPGDNMAYLKELFKSMKFDENLLGYTVAEDIDFGYRLSRKFKNSIFITPHAKLTHRYSFKERQPSERASFLNQVDHFYFNFKNLNSTFKEKIIFFWTLLGITALRIALFLLHPEKKHRLKLKHYFASLWYCFTHLQRIRRGRVREFDAYLSSRAKDL